MLNISISLSLTNYSRPDKEGERGERRQSQQGRSIDHHNVFDHFVGFDFFENAVERGCVRCERRCDWKLDG